MKPVLYYLLQLFLASGLLYGYYHYVLRNKRFHHYNRFYLLGAVVISILIPFLDIPFYFTPEETHSSFVIQTLTQLSFSTPNEITVTPTLSETTKQNWFTWQNILYAFYLLLTSIFLLRVLISLHKISTLIRKNKVEKLEHIRIINTQEPGTPFSFFKWLFWNTKIDLQSSKGEQVFRHELFHIKQRHSWDILFMELITVVFWLNPFFHLLKKELKAIHEFLADEFAIKETEKWQYAELLLMQAFNTKIHLTNPFFHNQIKRRIAMITSSSQPKFQYLRKLLVLPIAAVIIMLFAFSYNERKNNSLTDSRFSITDTIPKPHSKRMTFYSKPDMLILEADTVISIGTPYKQGLTLKKSLVIVNGKKTDPGILSEKTIIAKKITVYPPGNAKAMKIYGENAKNGLVLFEDANILDISPAEFYKEDLKKIKPADPDNIIFEKVEIEPSFPGGAAAWKRYTDNSLSGFDPSKNGAPKGIYTVYIQFIVDTDGNLSDIKALTNHGYGMEKEAMSVISKGPRWVPAIQNGKTVKAYRKQRFDFAVNRKAAIVVEQSVPISEIRIKDTTPANVKQFENALIVLNGIEQTGLTLSQVTKKMDDGNFESLEIRFMKPDIAIKKYGTKGEKGVVELNTNGKKPVIKNEVPPYSLSNVDNKVFEKVEIEASFPGGEEAWKRYLAKQFNSAIPLEKGAPEGTYTVIIQFIVDRQGIISDIKPLTNHGYGMEDEAIRVISRGPRWIPAQQNGHKVTAYRKQPVNFIVSSHSNNSGAVKDYNDPANWDYADPEFKKWWNQAIREIKAIALKEGKAAYIYKGRTYVFARITNPDPNVASFSEQNGTAHLFLLNGELVNSIEEINKRFKRNDIKKLNLIFKEDALKRFNINEAIVSIETFDGEIITKN